MSAIEGDLRRFFRLIKRRIRINNGSDKIAGYESGKDVMLAIDAASIL